MNKISLLSITSVLTLALFASNASAKYNAPADTAPTYAKDARYLLNNLDKDYDGRLSLDEYKGRPNTRDFRRQTRKAKKEGMYLPPEEEFNVIDTNEDGYIDQSELNEYFKNKPEE